MTEWAAQIGQAEGYFCLLTSENKEKQSDETVISDLLEEVSRLFTGVYPETC